MRLTKTDEGKHTVRNDALGSINPTNGGRYSPKTQGSPQRGDIQPIRTSLYKRTISPLEESKSDSPNAAAGALAGNQ